MIFRSPGISAPMELSVTSKWLAGRLSHNRRAFARAAKPFSNTKNRNARKCGTLVRTARLTFSTYALAAAAGISHKFR
jgi:hypothetical protein